MPTSSSPLFYVLFAIAVAGAIVITFVRARNAGRKIRADRERAQAATNQSLTEHHTPHWSQGAASFSERPEHWAMSIAAPYALCRGSNNDELRFRDADNERAVLAEAWGVTDRASMLITLYDLLTSGHRADFGEEIAMVTALTDTEAKEYEADLAENAKHSNEGAETLWRTRRVRANDREITTVDFLAWDLVRFAMLVRAGATTGYLSDAEAADFLLMIVPEIREHYGSWDELGRSFHVGRWFWNSQGGINEAETDEHDASRQEALLSSQGPWSFLEWDAELPASRMLFASALAADTNLAAQNPDVFPGSGWAKRLNDEIWRLRQAG